MLHRYSALTFWDYATAGPYVDINMNPVISGTSQQSSAYKDAIFLSPHKFVGGVETPGVLVAKKSLFKNPVPSGGGGGSVFFVSFVFFSPIQIKYYDKLLIICTLVLTSCECEVNFEVTWLFFAGVEHSSTTQLNCCNFTCDKNYTAMSTLSMFDCTTLI
ncbi:uncharacterized protein LOC117293387 [Asterias rubens]|uniref:uncharacterized protein LOC117293387 n=1 Tax=Asterias rubens TaxID=7604 RepID=UPI00145578E1|nr:uncharacterized protein LOC117293387 [Asterias rubens]